MTSDQGTLEGLNEWTVAWQVPEGLDLRDRPPVSDYEASESDIETFQRDGVVVLRGAFANWVEPLRRGLERNLADPESYAFPCESTEEGAPGRFFDSYCNWLLIPEYRDYVLTSCAASMAGRFMGANSVQFFHDHVFVKEPGTRTATPWHQDLPYYCVDGFQTVSMYVSLDHVPEETAVRFAAGSHRWGKLFYPRVFLDGTDFNVEDTDLVPIPDIDGHPDEFDIRCWALAPGDAVLFDFRTLHGSTDAPVESRRRAFSTRWLGDDVRYLARPGETSPPYGDMGLESGARMREDWFPVLWRCG